jgi:hypothetical protein
MANRIIGFGQPFIAPTGYRDPGLYPYTIPSSAEIPALSTDMVPSPPVGRPSNGIAPEHERVPVPHHRNEPPPVYTPPSPRTEVEGWWIRQSTTTKLAIVGGAAFGLGLLVSALLSRRPYRSNRRRRYRSNLAPSRRWRKAAAPARGLRRKAAPKGKIRTVKGKRRFGSKVPPKRYWQKGARRPSDYGWPEGYKYPLIFRDSSGRVKRKETIKHIRAAKTYFSRSKHLYPQSVRRTIAARINRASRRYDAGPTKVKA